MIAIKTIIDNNFTSCCSSHYIVVSIAMLFKIMTEQCVLKEFKTEKESMFKKHLEKFAQKWSTASYGTIQQSITSCQ